jgi:hypothetical protein
MHCPPLENSGFFPYPSTGAKIENCVCPSELGIVYVVLPCMLAKAFVCVFPETDIEI